MGKYLAIGCLCALLAGCHDAPRKNPFDPRLTPAVEVRKAELDVYEGAVFLEWSQYAGRRTFAEYRILRNVSESTVVDTVGLIGQLRQTTFVDTSVNPNTVYEYRVAVVNQAGYAVPSDPVPVGPFSVPSIRLSGYEVDSHQGHIALRWEQYAGPDFERYEVWRRSFGENDLLLAAIGDRARTTWTDATPLPGKGYIYWVVTFAAGEEKPSQTQEASVSLPGIELLRADFTSQTATAELEWTRYDGPRFAAYEVIRQVRDESERVVRSLSDIADTTYTDSLLDGNTEYVYRIRVRTTWDGNVDTQSRERRGRFYALDSVDRLPSLGTEEVQAVGLAVDDADQLFVAATLISTTTARQMQNGIRIRFPDRLQYRSYFDSDAFEPARLSPIHIVIGDGTAYIAVRLDSADTLVGAVGLGDGGNPEAWKQVAPTGNAFPAGLFFERDRDLVLIDEEGLLYSFTPEGEMAIPGQAGSPREVRSNLENHQALPMKHVAMGAGAGLQGNDLLFMMAPNREEHHLIGRTLIYTSDSSYIWAGKNMHFDDGVGLGNGETLNPLAIAFDPSRIRLIVLDTRGRLQVLDARPEEYRPKDVMRYITKWGDFGAGQGEFLVDPPTNVAVAVDSQGRIYVADGDERIQIFTP